MSEIKSISSSSQPTSDKFDYKSPTSDGDEHVKIICLGDSAVGKSKLVERFIIQKFKPIQLSTYALTMYQHKMVLNDQNILADIWDTAGQERFNSMHPSYYHQAHACIMVFDVTRKITYKNLANWYKELREFRPHIPCLCAANKIDVDETVTRRTFQFPKHHEMPLYFVSASTGTNVVKLFNDAVSQALLYKNTPSEDYVDQVLQELDDFSINEELDEDEEFIKK